LPQRVAPQQHTRPAGGASTSEQHHYHVDTITISILFTSSILQLPNYLLFYSDISFCFFIYYSSACLVRSACSASSALLGLSASSASRGTRPAGPARRVGAFGLLGVVGLLGLLGGIGPARHDQRRRPVSVQRPVGVVRAGRLGGVGAVSLLSSSKARSGVGRSRRR